MNPMSEMELAELNRMMADYDNNVADVAAAAGLELVQWYDQSGGLYRNDAGRLAFGWEADGFDDQIDDVTKGQS